MDLEANRSIIAAALARIAYGDRAALQTVYQLTSAKLFGICLRILGERGAAEDVLQEVFVTVWRKAADFDPSRASPVAWLTAIARNRAIDQLRAERRAPRAAPIDAAAAISDPEPIADRAMEQSEANQRLHRCLDSLDALDRTALRAAFFDGNTYEALAARMNVPLGTMKSRIRRALLKLKSCLER
jgi:RNA polymerase sigma-70 factor (ECF subfamily)